MGYVLALVAAAALVPAEAGAASCAAEGSSTEAENAVARIYRASNDDTFACSKTTGKRKLLAIDAYEYLENLTLRGHFAAYFWQACEAGDHPCYASLEVLDVRRGREVFEADHDPLVLVLRSNGSIAWSVRGGVSGGWIFRHTARGTTRLDRGRDVDPHSLRLRGTKLEWRSGGERRRATLR